RPVGPLAGCARPRRARRGLAISRVVLIASLTVLALAHGLCAAERRILGPARHAGPVRVAAARSRLDHTRFGGAGRPPGRAQKRADRSRWREPRGIPVAMTPNL